MLKIPYYKQGREYTCGIACLRMVLEYFGLNFSEERLITIGDVGREGTTPDALVEIAKRIGAMADASPDRDIKYLRQCIENNIPPIVLIDIGILLESETEMAHYMVVKGFRNNEIVLADPDPYFGSENKIYDVEKFEDAWDYIRNWTIEVRK